MHRLAILLVFAALAGCSRLHFRERADKEVAGVLKQKDIFDAWKIQNFHVYPDSRARFADPSCPDNPPYPPDDYPAWLLSPNPQRPNKKSGTGRYEGKEYLEWIEQWNAENRASDAGAPPEPEASRVAKTDMGRAYLAALETTQTPYRLTLDQSVELA